ncbi:hypothetical protein NQ317_015931 [Molorchus minor]|uniref:Thaumatin-like protein n=1 Tax=Molorchus minor TaxID=1323400 RepID=A0ABQ9JKV4_9CUCU|nr:hypothetical protein NQ317_015931 [Molorchus minor]
MNVKVLRILSVACLLLVTANAVQFEIRNAGEPIWVGIQGNPGHGALRNGGFSLIGGESFIRSVSFQTTINAPDNWAGRFWSRTFCDPNSQHCATGDCGNRLECNGAGGNPPVTLVEITLKGASGLDFYDISLVDGFNNKAIITPVNGQGDGGQYSCKTARCSSDINSKCPGELQVKRGNQVVACNSACNAFHTDQYCCTGPHNQPQTCRSSDWPQNYPAFFKKECPDAYSYAYDDHKSTFTCKAGKYIITFGQWLAEDFSGSISAVPDYVKDVNIPETKIELTLAPVVGPYAVSLLEGFNYKLKIIPIGGRKCKVAECPADIN